MKPVDPNPTVIVVMGVSGAGKTTVGSLLAATIGARFEEGDRWHPDANVEKMGRGEPLEDADRWPWLDAMAGAIREWLATDRRTVLACSALKQRYRDRLSGGRRGVAFVHLKGPIELIAARLAARKDHFMPLSLLPSQFAALEEPQSAVVVDIHDDPPTLVSTIKSTLRL